MSDAPANIQEFNQIVGLIFAQLYKSFPAGQDIDKEGIAKRWGLRRLIGANTNYHRATLLAKWLRIQLGGLTWSNIFSHLAVIRQSAYC